MVFVRWSNVIETAAPRRRGYELPRRTSAFVAPRGRVVWRRRRALSVDHPDVVRTVMERRSAARAAVVVAACALSTACAGRAAPLEVSVAFVNTWRVEGETLSAEDRAIVERTALDTLRRAFDGF